MSKKHLQRIFDPYFTTKEKGSGLGLATSHSIIKKHGGHITVKSKIGVGTTFHIYLPSSEKEIFTMEEVAEKDFFGGTGKILFMDDQEGIREMAGLMLDYLGYNVVFAGGGDEAIELYKKAKKSGQVFNAVILDLTLPGGMGGEEAIQKLIEIDPEVKAIVSSAYANGPIISDYEKYGFKGIVIKPYSIKGLSDILYKIIIGEGKP